MPKKLKNEKGKIKLSKVFQELKIGDKVAVKRDLGENFNFHKRLEGRVGTIAGKRGRAYIVKIKEYNKEKTHIIKPAHLRKM